jgi:hypothetical protein
MQIRLVLIKTKNHIKIFSENIDPNETELDWGTWSLGHPLSIL